MVSRTIGIWCISVPELLGGAGLVIAEATAVSPEGRITPGDAGIWSDKQRVEPIARINRFLKQQGAVPAESSLRMLAARHGGAAMGGRRSLAG